MTATPTSLTEPLPGYHLLERLGAGGFGEVWKAEAPGGLFKAIKIIRGELDEDTAAQQEFKALQRVKNLQHPFLLSLERADVVEGQLVIVMELAECNLMQRLEQCQAKGLTGIPRSELLHYMEEAAEALDFMNDEHSLQHLDIKPQNLFLIRKHLKVADFGLAKDLEGTHAALSSGITPTYAAPETFEGSVSHFCDQYSLAIVYQELLTGKRPFDGKNPRHLLLQHLTQEPNLSSLPVCDRASVGRALAKDPTKRFPSCLDFVRSLAQEAKAPAPAPAGEPVRVSISSAQTPPARKALSRTSIAIPKMCPRCGSPVREDSAFLLCSNCGHCSTLESSLTPAKREEPAPDEPSWTWGLLGGVIVISGLAVACDFLAPKNSEVRAMAGLAQLVLGGMAIIVAQIVAVMAMVAMDGSFDLKDVFLLSGRLWIRVFQCLPKTRWPVYLLSWGLLLATTGLFVGDLGYWSRYHRPRKAVDTTVQRSLKALDEKGNGDASADAAADVPQVSSAESTSESGAPIVQVVAVGYIPSEDGNSFSGVIMATLRNGKLVSSNVVEQGYTPEKRDELLRKMERLERPQPPKWWRGEAPAGVVWVQADSKDAVVCEVEGEDANGKLAKARYRGLARK